jgi:glucan phosphoethanolaminetransferase (alkaline phosphatase superfamily)
MTNTISIPTTKNRLPQPAIRTILLAFLVAGTLDITYATTMWGPVFGKVTATQLLQGIASNLIGKGAFSGGIATALLGLAMHYCISLAWTLLYFFIFPYLPFLARNKWVSGILYGVFVWAMMGMVVMPIVTGRAYQYSTVPFIKSLAPMVLLFGPAIALIINRYYFTVSINEPEVRLSEGQS